MPSLPLPKGKPLDVPRTVHRALELHHQGRIAEAEQLYTAVLAARPDHFDALQMLGVIKLARGELVTALRLVAAAMQLRPKSPQILLNYGLVLNAMNRPQEALASFDEALKLKGRFAEALNNRGAVLVTLERHAEALENFERAIAIKPDYVEAFYNQGNALKGLDRYDEALKSYDRAIALRPSYAKPHCNRGSVLDILGRPADALVCYDRALAIQPDFAEAMLNRCGALRGLKRIDETMQSLERLLTVHPAYAEAHVMRGMLMADFNRYLEALASFERALALKPDYSKARWGSCTAALPILYAEEGEMARQLCHRFVQGPASTEHWRRTILADRPHVLIYPDIGMSTEASELAALRLAPAQCGYIGHPQTSGFPTLDYFLSGELIEPANGQDHYIEKLVKLANAGFYYEPLALPPAAVTREELGLRPNATAYWCAQSLFKYLPQHDEVFPRIAREAGDCQFVFIRHFGREVTELFQKRLDRAFAAAGLKADDHCVFLDGMEMSRFAAASAQCDLMLDSIGWSGGNTTLEALAQDLPVVTFQGELMRGRVSAGILRMMGMPETIV